MYTLEQINEMMKNIITAERAAKANLHAAKPADDPTRETAAEELQRMSALLDQLAKVADERELIRICQGYKVATPKTGLFGGLWQKPKFLQEMDKVLALPVITSDRVEYFKVSMVQLKCPALSILKLHQYNPKDLDELGKLKKGTSKKWCDIINLNNNKVVSCQQIIDWRQELEQDISLILQTASTETKYNRKNGGGIVKLLMELRDDLNQQLANHYQLSGTREYSSLARRNT